MIAEERVRFCDHCNAVIGWYSSFCEECGLKLGSKGRARGRTLGQPEADSVERDLFRAHMRLLHRCLEQVARLDHRLGKTSKRLKALESGQSHGDPLRTVLLLSEQLLDFEQDWEELQETYNRHSESLEEEFLARMGEMEVDIELSPEHQEAVEGEMSRLVQALERFEEELRECGRRLEVVQARRRSHVLRIAGSRSGWIVLALLGLGLPALGIAWGVVFLGLGLAALLIVSSPALMVICVLLLALGTRSR